MLGPSSGDSGPEHRTGPTGDIHVERRIVKSQDDVDVITAVDLDVLNCCFVDVYYEIVVELKREKTVVVRTVLTVLYEECDCYLR